jgi:hypothetical protein
MLFGTVLDPRIHLAGIVAITGISTPAPRKFRDAGNTSGTLSSAESRTEFGEIQFPYLVGATISNFVVFVRSQCPDPSLGPAGS